VESDLVDLADRDANIVKNKHRIDTDRLFGSVAIPPLVEDV
jgi:hypothetical protein